MGNSHFDGAITAGRIKHTTGSTLGQNVKNTGFVKLAQSYEYTQTASAVVVQSTITIPAGSQVLGVQAWCTTTFDGTDEKVSIGFDSLAVGITTDLFVAGANDITAEQYASVYPNIGAVATAPTIVAGTAAKFKDVGTTDVSLYIKTTTDAGVAGRMLITVTYLQALDLT